MYLKVGNNGRVAKISNDEPQTFYFTSQTTNVIKSRREEA
jgi:hypothetical protein